MQVNHRHKDVWFARRDHAMPESVSTYLFQRRFHDVRLRLDLTFRRNHHGVGNGSLRINALNLGTREKTKLIVESFSHQSKRRRSGNFLERAARGQAKCRSELDTMV